MQTQSFTAVNPGEFADVGSFLLLKALECEDKAIAKHLADGASECFADERELREQKSEIA